MKKTLILTAIILAGICSAFLLLFVVIFKWHFVSYPNNPTEYNPTMCYSPNHEFYIKRYQTVAASLWNDYGIAVVYDKSGHRISKGNAYLAEMANLLWSSKNHGAVSMTGGGDGNDLFINLPYLPVNGLDDIKEGCY